jgi:DNA polymerase III alpha subunit
MIGEIMKEFVSIHNHTSLGSLLDAIISVDELFDKVKEFGQKAVAITDHGTLGAHYDAFQAYKRTGIKFIPGCEMYFVHSFDAMQKKEGRGRKRYERSKHLVLLAKNEIGYKNLLKLNYIGFEHKILIIGKVYPRVNWDLLEKYSEGLIATSACATGILSRFLLNDQFDEACEAAQRLASIYKSGFYIEIQPHNLKDGDLDQHILNKQLINIGHKFGIPLVAGVDVHYVTKESEKYHDMLLALKEKVPVDDPDRFRYGIDEYYVKTGDQVYDFLAKSYGDDVAEEAVSNTVKIADLCEPPDYMMVSGNHLPVFDPKVEEDYNEFLEWRIKAKLSGKLKEDAEFMRFRIFKGFKKKLNNLSKEEMKFMISRIKSELTVLEGNNFSSYMLITADIINWSRKNNILVGAGRGCLTKDSLVLTNKSFKKLKDIKIGDFVYTHKGNLKRVLNTFKYKIKNEDLIQLKTDYSYGSITLTNDHKVYGSKAVITDRYEKYFLSNWKPPFKGKKYHLINEPKFIPISDLLVDDFIFMPFPKNPSVDIKSLDLKKYIGIYDKLVNDTIYSKIPLNNDLSIRTVSKNTNLDRGTVQRIKYGKPTLEKSRIVLSKYLCKYGISLSEWMNDKNVDIRKTNRYLQVDEEFCYIIGRWIGDGWIQDKNNSYRLGIAFNRDDINGKSRIIGYFENLGFKCGVQKHKKKNLDQVYIYSYVLTKLFRDLFPEYKNCSSSKYIGQFQGLPNSKLKSLINGIIHSDGHFDGKRESIDTTSERLLNDIRESLLYLKIPSYVSFRESHYKDEYLCKKSYKIRFTGFNTPFSKVVKSRIFDKGYYVQIKDINLVEEDVVYDIETEDLHSYLTQNFAVHNSAGGSLVAYLLDIHEVNPIEYGLLFERFQNAYKTDLPDIDTDFTSAGRDAVKEYCRGKYGVDFCAQVSNINTYTPKNVIPGLVKSMRNVMPGLIPKGEYYVKVSNAIRDAIPDKDKDGNKVKTLKHAISLSKDLESFAERCPELMEYADALIGLPKEYSTHAGGMVISDVPILDFAPLRVDKNNVVAVQYDKNRCESVGLVKMDFLAITTLDVIDETFKNIETLDSNGPKKMGDIPLDDSKVFEMIQDGNTKCVFQLGASGKMINLCKGVKSKDITDIAFINALGRPSSSSKEGKEFAARRFGKSKVTHLHPSLENAFGETYGLGLFEEQLLKVAQDVAGWDLSKADGLRKLTKLKGKNPKLALQLEKDFIEGTMNKHNLSYEKSKEIWDNVVEPFSGYGFNKSHAVSYSINGYITAYLKYYYPAAFLAAYLKVKTNKSGVTKEAEIASAKSECKRMGISIVPPDINHSGAGYEVLDDNTIVMGFAAIKGLGPKAVDEIVSGQPYDTFTDFIRKTSGRVINKSKMEVLGKAGCFDLMKIPRKDVHDYGKINRDKFNIWSKKQLMSGKLSDGYDIDKVQEEFPLKFIGDEWERSDQLRYEREVLGELLSGNLNDLFPGFFTGVNATSVSDLKGLPNRHDINVEFLVLELLREFKIKKGRYSGQSMIKYRVSDAFGVEIELTVWPTEYNVAKQVMKPGSPIRARCQVSDYEGSRGIILRSIERVYNVNNT